jgi:hypothetical protein
VPTALFRVAKSSKPFCHPKVQITSRSELFLFGFLAGPLGRPLNLFQFRLLSGRGVASTNVMTTNTTLLAISAAEILLGWIECRKSGSAATYAQAHREFAALCPLGVGFFGGTAIGAIAFIILGLPCILAAIIPVGGLALWYARNAD